MDNRAAAQYMDQMYGTRTGYVAVAYKAPNGKTWEEQQFAWPSGKGDILAWAEAHKGDNVFICPALRRGDHTRKKGDMADGHKWLWADVDWAGVPEDRRDDVTARIKELGSLVVRSGSGDNVHVYVEMSRGVDHQTFIKLNTGLRDYLYADNKQADNSLLRLPGTTNWKTSDGSVVRLAGGLHGGKALDPSALMKRRAFRDAKVIQDADSTEWEFVELDDLPRRVRALVTMRVDEATAKYGNRHKAVWAITGELHKRGFGPDEVHSLMDQFPAAVSKAAEENGYDVHRDVDKRLAYERATAALTHEESEEIEDEAFELASEEDDATEYEARIMRLAMAELERSEARKKARTMEAERAFIAPPDDVSWSLSDALIAPPRPVPHLIMGYADGDVQHKGLAGVKHNVVITAQYKTGKTVFVTGALGPAICDGMPFLDRYPVNVPEGGMVMGHWNCEMDPGEMLDDYIRPVGIKHTDNLKVANLRGYNVNLLSPNGREWAAEWLRSRGVKVWTIDSFARVARMAGVSEKDNDEVMGLLMALDEIKIMAGVNALFLITHTGRAEMEEGKERARGATAIDDWADARWVMTKEANTRLLQVEGRSVHLDKAALSFDPMTLRYEMGYGGIAEVRANGAVQVVTRVVKENPGSAQTALLKLLNADPIKMSARAAKDHIQEAIDGGFIRVEEVRRAAGGKAERQHWLVGSDKPTGDRMRRATPQDVVVPRVRTTRRQPRDDV